MADDFENILPPSYQWLWMAASWSRWMAVERNTVAPILFEVFLNASTDMGDSDSYEVILDNATHLIEEWKHIKWTGNPNEEFIGDLWSDLRLAFDYLLRTTPRLEFDVEEVLREEGQPNNVSLRLQVRNLSPRLATVESLNVQKFSSISGTGLGLLEVLPSLREGQRQTETIHLNVPLGAENYTIRIGNEYVGYGGFAIDNPEPSQDESSSIGGFRYWIPLLAMTLLFWKKTGSKSRVNHYMRK